MLSSCGERGAGWGGGIVGLLQTRKWYTWSFLGCEGSIVPHSHDDRHAHTRQCLLLVFAKAVAVAAYGKVWSNFRRSASPPQSAKNKVKTLETPRLVRSHHHHPLKALQHAC